MRSKRLRARPAEAKDVTPRGNASEKAEARKKSADSLPKILALAARGGSLHAQRVRCGKPKCRCAHGELHEGYYLFLSSPAGLSKFYVRRADVPAVRSAIAARRQRRSAWRAELTEARAFLRRLMSAAIGG